MHLGQAEALRMFNDHHGCIWHIDAHFNHRGRDQHIELPALKAAHDDLFLIRIHPSVQQAQAQTLKGAGFQFLIHVGSSLERGRAGGRNCV